MVDTFDLHPSKIKDDSAVRATRNDLDGLGEEEEDIREDENNDDEDDDEDGTDAMSSSPSIPDDVRFIIFTTNRYSYRILISISCMRFTRSSRPLKAKQTPLKGICLSFWTTQTAIGGLSAL